MNERYSKQIILDKIGTKGQQKIAESKVAIVGIGALGTVAAELLARSGVGELLLIDRDVVEKSNLQRQMLFSEKDIGQSKATSASKKLKEINSEIIINPTPPTKNSPMVSSPSIPSGIKCPLF